VGKRSSKNGGHTLQRREFIKMGAGGLAASLSGCATTSTTESKETPDQEAAANAAGISAQSMPPEVGELIDPMLLQAETWHEPWVWQPERWPEDALELNVVASQNPGLSPSPGNPRPSLFSYNGSSPGPTVRVRSDGEVRFRVRNMLGLDQQSTPVGPYPDPIDIAPDTARKICSLVEEQVLGGDPENPGDCPLFIFPEQVQQVLTNAKVRPGWSIKDHINGIHGTHVTNLHTHGLHVFPNVNPDGSYSDDVHLRIISKANWEARQNSGDENLATLAHHEHVGHLDYKMQLSFERDGERLPHPPGTHWYHPHSHGSTHNQVASGMAGFLIVEGDVDDAINTAMTGEPRPRPEIKTGPYDYRERLIFIQRVFVQSIDLDAGSHRNELRFPPLTAINGTPEASMIRMRPGAVERWRVLNGSVDGAGTKRFMVLDGQYVQRNNRIWRVVAEGDAANRKRRLEPISDQDIEDAKLDLHQLSFDGITLVREKDGKASHYVKDLSKQNKGTKDPLASTAKPGPGEYQARMAALESVFENGDSLRRAFVRPNEVYLTNANRSDVFFKAPVDAAGRVFTVFAKEAHIQTDNYQRFLQRRIKDPERNARRELFDTIVAYVYVDGDPVEGGDFDIQSLSAELPAVPELLQPVSEDELKVPSAEARKTKVPEGSRRCRTIAYSGTGGAEFPSIEVPDDYAEAHPELEDLTWATHEGTRVLIPPVTHTMGIHTEFDLAANPEPGPPRKFMPADPHGSRMLVNTAEEWVLYNTSQMMWARTNREKHPQPGSYANHHRSYPISRAEGQRRFAEDQDFMITAKGNDHPFHIHINPIWVLRIDVPDEHGELHNVLPEPRWMDTVAIPRNGGRVVFRTRFDDFVGKWVNHCHVLMHEDNGMMQEVECTDDASRVNYHFRTKAASPSMSGKEVDAIYPRPSRELMYVQNLSFVDPNEAGYQEFPGFGLKVPKLVD
jgi:FtsP/CotA-like multicopper oxidase with cupredoxin domain